MAELWLRWMPTRAQMAFDRALDQDLHDLFNSMYPPGPDEVAFIEKSVQRSAVRIAGWRWREIRDRIFARDGYTCTYCFRSDLALDCDHVIPLSRGGSNEDDNLTTACFACNRSKSDKLLSEWRPN